MHRAFSHGKDKTKTENDSNRPGGSVSIRNRIDTKLRYFYPLTALTLPTVCISEYLRSIHTCVGDRATGFLLFISEEEEGRGRFCSLRVSTVMGIYLVWV